jgi:hypothetical protein
VARAEEEDSPAAALEGAAAAEHFATRIPGDEYQFVRLRDVEGLAVHFRRVDLEIGRQALGDRMRGIDHPNALQVALRQVSRQERLAFVPIRRRKSLEWWPECRTSSPIPLRTRCWTRSIRPSLTSSCAMWPHQSSTSVSLRTESGRPSSGSSSVPRRISKSGCDAGGDRAVDTVRVNLLHFLVQLLVAPLVPDGNLDCHDVLDVMKLEPGG